MRFSLVVAALATSASASTWFGKTDVAYNKWHETELERWLSDHNVPYPAPSDRKDLENLVKSNWNDQVVAPYNSWDTKQLNAYAKAKGIQTKKGTENTKDSLLQSIKATFTQTDDQVSSSYANTRDWILDSWSESQLKAFCDRNSIPVPQPRTRDSYLKVARENYNSVATKLGETAAYPGNWLYESWSESDLKAWCDERGVPVPQPSNRDKLIASVRRNSRISANTFSAYTSSASASASSASQVLSDALFSSWSESELKAWFDKNGIKVPQGSKKNEMVALARKNAAKLTGENVSYSASSAYGAATSAAGNQYAQATEDAALKAGQAQGVFYDYFSWAKSLVVGGASTASSSYTSATGTAASSLSSFSSSLSSAASSASVSASKAAAKSGPKEAKKAGDAASESLSKAKHRVQESYQQATDRVREEL